MKAKGSDKKRVLCVFCGKEFEAMNKSKKYCSYNCRYEHKLDLKRIEREQEKETRIAKCSWCGKEYQQEYGRRYCSPECKRCQINERAREAKKNKRLKQYPKIVKCVYCGKEFEKPFGTTSLKYCSDECRDAVYKGSSLDQFADAGKKIKTESFAEIDRKCKELGISYGKYQLMKYLEEQKRKETAG